MDPIPISFYQANGATSGCLQDAEREFLLAQGATPAHNQDMWEEFLIGSGYAGSIQDMQYKLQGDVVPYSILNEASVAITDESDETITT